jgi:hypothetical protein
MRRLIIILVIGAIAWQAWGAYQSRRGAGEGVVDSEDSVTAQLLDQEAASDRRSLILCRRTPRAAAGPPRSERSLRSATCSS